MKKHIKNHDEILQLSNDVTSGLFQISSDITDEQLAEMGYELSSFYFYESERGDEKEVYVYQKDDSRIVKISNYIEREGGMFINVTFVPVEIANKEYQAEIEKELEKPSLYLIASILNRRKIMLENGEGFFNYSGTLGNYHFDMILKSEELSNKVINNFLDQYRSGAYNSDNPMMVKKIISVLNK